MGLFPKDPKRLSDFIGKIIDGKRPDLGGNGKRNIIVRLVKRYQNNMQNSLKKRKNVDWTRKRPFWWPKRIKFCNSNEGKWGTNEKCARILKAFFKSHSSLTAAQQSSAMLFPSILSQHEPASIDTVPTSGESITDPTGASPKTPLNKMSWVQNTPVNRVVGSRSSEQDSQGQTPSALGDNALPLSPSPYNLPPLTDVSKGTASCNQHGTRPTRTGSEESSDGNFMVPVIAFDSL